jgi:dUTP pyrophosphatase
MEIQVCIEQHDRIGYVSEQSAGLDIRMPSAVSLPALGQVIVDLKFSIALPAGTVGLLKVRSSWGKKILVNAGVIDSDYRGSLRAILQNLTSAMLDITPNDSVVQLLVQPVLQIRPLFVDKLSASARGESGFGSSGAEGGSKRQKVEPDQ